jgi:hypothetical protein
MESPNWPSARKHDTAQTPRKKRKHIACVAGEGHPQLELGSVNALSLWDNNDRLEWTSLRMYSEGDRLDLRWGTAFRDLTFRSEARPYRKARESVP